MAYVLLVFALTACSGAAQPATKPAEQRSPLLTSKPKAAPVPGPNATRPDQKVEAERAPVEYSISNLYVSGSLKKDEVENAVLGALDGIGDCDGRLTSWPSIVTGSVSLRIAVNGLPHRINLPSVADGPIGQCVKRALEPLMFGKQRRRTRISFTLEAVPSSLSMAALANLDKCDDVYRICLESVRTYSVPARELVAALMDVNLGGPCNRARTVERYSVRVQIAGDGTFSSVSVSVRSGRKESKACLQNELARARVGPTSNHSRQSASWTVRFDPASQQPYEGLPAHVRLGKIEREGSYSRTRLRKVLRSRLANIRKCYDLALVGDPRSGGESRLSFIVQGSGAISTPQVTGVDASLAACVSKEIGTLTAAKPRHGKAVPVVVPLTFVPARRGTR